MLSISTLSPLKWTGSLDSVVQAKLIQHLKEQAGGVLSELCQNSLQEQVRDAAGVDFAPEAACKLLRCLSDPDTGVSAAAKRQLEAAATTPEGRTGFLLFLRGLCKREGRW